MSDQTSPAKVAEREPTAATFAKHVAQHQMTVILDQGVHRYLRFRKPDDSNRYFHITTWPGYLCFSGDMGCYVFARVEDMFRFFRGDGINPSYWAEKVQARDRDGIKESDKLRAYVEEYTADWPEDAKQEAWDEILRHADDEHDARRALYDFEHKGHQFQDSWEADFTEYTYRFIWCCRAIVWAIQQYDAARAAAAPAAQSPAAQVQP